MSDHALYRFFDAKNRLLYVGITGDLANRFSGHRRDKPWWRDVITIRIERFDTRGELAAAEVRAIEHEHPKYNKIHAAGQYQTTKVRTRAVVSPGSEANTFGTIQREGQPILEPHQIRMSLPYPCPECAWPAVSAGTYALCLSQDCDWWTPLDAYERYNEPWRR